MKKNNSQIWSSFSACRNKDQVKERILYIPVSILIKFSLVFTYFCKGMVFFFISTTLIKIFWSFCTYRKDRYGRIYIYVSYSCKNNILQDFFVEKLFFVCKYLTQREGYLWLKEIFAMKVFEDIVNFYFHKNSMVDVW